MTRARNQLISLETTPYYHCISRCVRRAFLYGEDSLTGKNFDHRKMWVVERLEVLSRIYAIEICAYAVMSNHHHLVLRVDPLRAKGWSDVEVVEHWGKLFSLPVIVARHVQGERQTEAEIAEARSVIETWRERLCDISWFMRSLNEYLARRANKEDRCKGRFWEGRFKSQALLDEAAVLTCMSYVDLNPVRAGIAETPEGSDFTSIQQRIVAYGKQFSHDNGSQEETGTVVPLMSLTEQKGDRHPNAIGFSAMEYLALVDWAGRAVREGKRGAISGDIPPILQRVGLDSARFLEHLQGRTQMESSTAVGRVEQVKQAAAAFGRKFVRGVGEARRLYLPLPLAGV
ncbi:MAG: transposase [Candidatus Thiodiazotropha sp. (ex Dulcina madagascariensis)]|nr:transposase [Candidatus Thiodiazotropha sp. (ex Dulcina madagascariensis)]